VELTSADGGPLLQSRAVKVRLTDPYRAQTGKLFQVEIQGQDFKLELGKDYVLILEAGKAESASAGAGRK